MAVRRLVGTGGLEAWAFSNRRFRLERVGLSPLELYNSHKTSGVSPTRTVQSTQNEWGQPHSKRKLLLK